MAGLTPSQTIGPFLHIEVPYEGEDRLVDPNHPGAIRLIGTVTDGEGNAVDDGLVEIWQANPAGRYAHPEDDRADVPLEDGFTRVRALCHRFRGPLRVPHRQARTGAGPR